MSEKIGKAPDFSSLRPTDTQSQQPPASGINSSPVESSETQGQNKTTSFSSEVAPFNPREVGGLLKVSRNIALLEDKLIKAISDNWDLTEEDVFTEEELLRYNRLKKQAREIYDTGVSVYCSSQYQAFVLDEQPIGGGITVLETIEQWQTRVREVWQNPDPD